MIVIISTECECSWAGMGHQTRRVSRGDAANCIKP